MNLDGGASELIYCSDRCADTLLTTACVPELELRTGASADKECNCDPEIGLLNCGNEIAPTGFGCFHENGDIGCQDGVLTPCDLCEEDKEEDTGRGQSKRQALSQGQPRGQAEDVQLALDFQKPNIDRQALVQMNDKIALPGLSFRRYPWKRILADQLEAALAGRGLKIVDVDEEKEPLVSVIDRKGKELKEMSFKMIADDDTVFPITVKISIFLRHFQVDAQGRPGPLVPHDAGKHTEQDQQEATNPVGENHTSDTHVLGSIASIYCF